MHDHDAVDHVPAKASFVICTYIRLCCTMGTTASTTDFTGQLAAQPLQTGALFNALVYRTGHDTRFSSLTHGSEPRMFNLSAPIAVWRCAVMTPFDYHHTPLAHLLQRRAAYALPGPLPTTVHGLGTSAHSHSSSALLFRAAISQQTRQARSMCRLCWLSRRLSKTA